MRGSLPWPTVNEYPYHDFLSLLVIKTWHAKARCREPFVDPDWFFYERSSGERNMHNSFALPEIRAKTCCMRCPVRYECMKDGLYEPGGIWGGTLHTERDDYRHVEDCRPGNKAHQRDHRACIPDEEQIDWLLFDMMVQALEHGWIGEEEVGL